MELIDQSIKLLQILFVDLLLAGDNAIVIGLVAARFTPEYRKKIIFYGVGVAVVLRVIFALLTVQLLAIKGLALIGGVLLLWISWKLWQELRIVGTQSISGQSTGNSEHENPKILSAIAQIIVADLSMSIDNVVAVAGVADGHTGLLVIGLTVSVVFMMFFASWIATLLQKHIWIGYFGVAVILYVALTLIYDGYLQLFAIT